MSTVILAFALGIMWWSATSRLWEDMTAVLFAQARVSSFYSFTVEDWPPFLERRYYSLPKCIRPGFRAERALDGRVTRFKTKPLPDSSCGFRSNGPGGDEGPVFGVVLGDSYTIGEAVSDDETFVSRLSLRAHRRFLNLGVAGQGLTGHIARWREARAAGLSPRVVIVQLCGNDPLEDEWVAAAIRERSLVWPSVPPRTTVPPAIAPHHVLLSYVTGLVLGRIRGWPVRTQAQRRLFKTNLVELDHEIRNAGAIPVFLDVDNNLTHDAPAALGPGAAIVGFAPSWYEKLVLDGHWNEKGHASAARVLYAELAALGYFGAGHE